MKKIVMALLLCISPCFIDMHASRALQKGVSEKAAAEVQTLFVIPAYKNTQGVWELLFVLPKELNDYTVMHGISKNVDRQSDLFRIMIKDTNGLYSRLSQFTGKTIKTPVKVDDTLYIVPVSGEPISATQLKQAAAQNPQSNMRDYYWVPVSKLFLSNEPLAIGNYQLSLTARIFIKKKWKNIVKNLDEHHKPSSSTPAAACAPNQKEGAE